jgi:hypothetical protein
MKPKVDLRTRKILFREFDALGRKHGGLVMLNAMRKYVDIDRARRRTLKRISDLRRQLENVIGRNGRK